MASIIRRVLSSYDSPLHHLNIINLLRLSQLIQDTASSSLSPSVIPDVEGDANASDASPRYECSTSAPPTVSVTLGQHTQRYAEAG